MNRTSRTTQEQAIAALQAENAALVTALRSQQDVTARQMATIRQLEHVNRYLSASNGDWLRVIRRFRVALPYPQRANLDKTLQAAGIQLEERK